MSEENSDSTEDLSSFKESNEETDNNEENSFPHVTPKFNEPITGNEESDNEDRFESVNGTPMQRMMKRRPTDNDEERSFRRVTPKLDELTTGDEESDDEENRMPRSVPILDNGKRMYVRTLRQRATPKLAKDSFHDAQFKRSSMCREMYKRNNLLISVEKNSSSMADRMLATSLTDARVDSSTDDEKTPMQTTFYSRQNLRMFERHFHQSAQDNSSESEATEDDIVRGKTNGLKLKLLKVKKSLFLLLFAYCCICF